METIFDIYRVSRLHGDEWIGWTRAASADEAQQRVEAELQRQVDDYLSDPFEVRVEECDAPEGLLQSDEFI